MGNIERINVLNTSKKSLKIGETNSNIKSTYSRTYEESPIFQFKNDSTITLSGGRYVVDFENEKNATGKYLPFNSMKVSNNSSSEIIVQFNQDSDRAVFMGAGDVIVFDRKTMPSIRSLAIKNVGTTTNVSVDEIYVEVWREGVILDSAIKSIHKMIVRNLFSFTRGE